MIENVIGRTPLRTAEAGTKASIMIGRELEHEEQIYFDVSKPHVCLVTGKRGSGKSYSQSAIIEGIAHLDENVRKHMSVIVLDTMGIFWSLKYPNTNKTEVELLDDYGLKPQGANAELYVPEQLKSKHSYGDSMFSIAPSEVSPENWCLTFRLDQNAPRGIALTRAIRKLQKEGGFFDIDDIISEVRHDKRAVTQTKEALENRLEAANSWGVFSSRGLSVKDFVKGGKISIVDISQLYYSAETWSVRALIVALICESITTYMIEHRRESQSAAISGEESSGDHPSLVWIFIDEAHQFLPSGSSTPASWPLKRIIREGRQPGISLVLATQQPGKLDTDVLTQSDVVISHHISSKLDIDGLNKIMNTYQKHSIQESLNRLPKMPGAALVIDDTRETIQEMRVRPKVTLHAGDSPDVLAKVMQSFG